MLSLHDKVALITGAGSGIGRASAILFQQLGCQLTLLDKNEPFLNETIALCCHESEKKQTARCNNGKILKIVGHVEDPEVQKRAVDETITEFGKLNILINNAGIYIEGSALLDTSVDDYDKIMNINLKSIVFLTKLCTPHLIQSKGSIVNVSSIRGTNPSVGSLPYSLSKAGLDQFTRCTALELAEYGIRVNSVNPGDVVTNIRRSCGFTEEECQKYYDQVAHLYPLTRVAIPDEIANTIAFLASDMSSFTTGQLVKMDGGATLTCVIDTCNNEQ